MTSAVLIDDAPQLTGAEIVLRALEDQGVDTIFGYPGGAILPVYDAMFQRNSVRHILVRHEQGAAHAAEGYARSSPNKVGVILVTSGPGMTNTITGLMDAMMDSIPVVCICGQVPSHLIGTDAFQEADTTGISRSCTKHNVLVKDVNKLAEEIHKCFHIARSGRPGPVLIDIPKDVQFARGQYITPDQVTNYKTYPKAIDPADAKIAAAVDLMQFAKRPVFYTGGGVINAGPDASTALRALVHETEFPITQTLMGLGCFPSSDNQFLGMLGMHGTYEANLAMYHADLIIGIGARFDDRITGNLKEFSPNAQKIHIDIDASSINKIVHAHIGIVADAGAATNALLNEWRHRNIKRDQNAHDAWWQKITEWRAKNSLSFKPSSTIIKPQHAVQRLYEKTKHRRPIITTEVGQHQMWAAQHFGFDDPNKWLTSGGLGTMGYGLPAAIGAQVANPNDLVIDIAGEASILMNMQEWSTAVQFNLPVKVFILNNEWMGMVRQWQQLIHGERYSHSYSEALPDFVKLAEAYGLKGLRVSHPDQLDATIDEMIAHPGPVMVDVRVDPNENVYPMIPSGAAHHQMILEDMETGPAVTEEGLRMV